MRLAEIDQFMEQVEDLLLDCPEEFRLGSGADFAIDNTPSDLHIDLTFLSDLSDSTESPSASGSPGNITKTAYLWHHANLYVTQQALLFFALKYKEELLRGQGSNPGRSHRHQASIRTDKSRLIRQLLRILQTLPVEAIAFISLPGLTKIRYVAADLLTALEPGDGSSPCPAVGTSALPPGEQGEMLAQLSQYLRLLADIEATYSLRTVD
ncbi:hypothetical protein JCM24511_09839 [Saitozyma sp. JCM 24511]|nr:hypothetical protein JCM24511_09839 [Saitozyma sp. JCM 24511]